MNRDEFEKSYAEKYTAGDVLPVFCNRDGEGYTDHHIDLCWKIEKISNLPSWEISHAIFDLEW